jgi:hypothetical protein
MQEFEKGEKEERRRKANRGIGSRKKEKKCEWRKGRYEMKSVWSKGKERKERQKN